MHSPSLLALLSRATVPCNSQLGARGVLQLLVEGGSEIHTEFLRAGLVDEVHMYKGSTVLGHGGIPWVTADMARTISDANFWYGNFDIV